MQKQFTEFMQRINSDEFLKQQMSGIEGAGDIVRLARSMDFQFSEADVERALTGVEEMAEEELLCVAGGTLNDLSTGFATCPVGPTPR